MATAAPEIERPTAAEEGENTATDVLVVFGITGDLAKVMTFRSLYRLERRGLLDCPIVGVAVDDWSVDQLKERARTSIEGTGEQLDPEVFERFANRLSYVEGDFGDASTYDRVAKAIGGALFGVVLFLIRVRGVFVLVGLWHRRGLGLDGHDLARGLGSTRESIPGGSRGRFHRSRPGREHHAGRDGERSECDQQAAKVASESMHDGGPPFTGRAIRPEGLDPAHQR